MRATSPDGEQEAEVCITESTGCIEYKQANHLPTIEIPPLSYFYICNLAVTVARSERTPCTCIPMSKTPPQNGPVARCAEPQAPKHQPFFPDPTPISSPNHACSIIIHFFPNHTSSIPPPFSLSLSNLLAASTPFLSLLSRSCSSSPVLVTSCVLLSVCFPIAADTTRPNAPMHT